MKVLLDTCVISQIGRPNGSEKVQAVINRYPDENLFISVITIGEINKGIHRLTDPKRVTELQNWLTSIQKYHADRILNVSSDVAEIWGRITAEEQNMGRILSAADGLIAATAINHGLTVATRNTGDFSNLNIMLMNPWLDT
jgi:predicted nucleic acid-binding protein